MMTLPACYRWTIVREGSSKPFAPKVLLERRYDEEYIWRTFKQLRQMGVAVDLVGQQT